MTLITRLRAWFRLTRAIPPATTDPTEKSSRASTATPTMRLSGQRRPASSRVAPLIGTARSSARGVGEREDGQVIIEVSAVQRADVLDHPVQQHVVGGRAGGARLAVAFAPQRRPDQVHQAFAAEPLGALPDPALDQPVGVQ